MKRTVTFFSVAIAACSLHAQAPAAPAAAAPASSESQPRYGIDCLSPLENCYGRAHPVYDPQREETNALLRQLVAQKMKANAQAKLRQSRKELDDAFAESLDDKEERMDKRFEELTRALKRK